MKQLFLSFFLLFCHQNILSFKNWDQNSWQHKLKLVWQCLKLIKARWVFCDCTILCCIFFWLLQYVYKFSRVLQNMYLTSISVQARSWGGGQCPPPTIKILLLSILTIFYWSYKWLWLTLKWNALFEGIPMLICEWQTSILLWLSSIIARKLIPLFTLKL